jgi:hypothetical protein
MEHILDGVEFNDNETEIFDELRNCPTITKRIELAESKLLPITPKKSVYERYLDNVMYIINDVDLTSYIRTVGIGIFGELELLPNAESRINFCKIRINELNNDMTNKHAELNNILNGIDNPVIVEGITIDIAVLRECESDCLEDIDFIESKLKFYSFYLGDVNK